MRNILIFLAVGFLAAQFTTLLRADDTATARAVIDKAIKAAGGEEKLAKFKNHTWKNKGTWYGLGDGVPYTASYAVAWPDKFRFEVEGGFMTYVIDGDKGWVQAMGGETHEFTKDEMADQKEVLHASRVFTLLPLKDKAYKLSLLDETKVADKPAIGVKVSHKDYKDVLLYFDKDTGLLVKSENKVKVPEEGNKEVNQETLYSDYQDVEGAKMAMKITHLRDGKKYAEGENFDIKIVDKHDDKTFAKPG
jgi:hypothetical protein